MTTEEILPKIGSIKDRVQRAKDLPNYQFALKANIVESVVIDAVWVIEEMAKEQKRLEELLDHIVANGDF